MALLTIVIPIFKAPELFIKTYESILKSPLVEIIVVEKVSNLNLKKELLDKNTIYLKQNGSGQYAAIRQGISHAKTHYVTWLNAGDLSFILEETIQDLALIQNESAILVFNRSWHDKRIYRDRRNTVCRSAVIRGDYNGVKRRYLQAESMIFTKALFSKSKAFEKYQLAGDFYLWIDLFSDCEKVIRIDRYLFSFLLHEGRSVRYRERYLEETGQTESLGFKKLMNSFFVHASYNKVEGMDANISSEFSWFEFPLRLIILKGKLKQLILQKDEN